MNSFLSGYEKFPLAMTFSKFHSHIGYEDKKVSFADWLRAVNLINILATLVSELIDIHPDN